MRTWSRARNSQLFATIFIKKIVQNGFLAYNECMDIYSSVLDAVNAGDNIFVGVSGGADSMVLLHALLAARTLKDFDLHVIHVEHGIRGKDSLNDANFVQ